MHLMHISMWSMDASNRPDQDLVLDRIQPVEEAEAARMAVVEGMLGGPADWSAPGVGKLAHAMYFIRRDPGAPGGIGRILVAQLATEAGERLYPRTDELWPTAALTQQGLPS